MAQCGGVKTRLEELIKKLEEAIRSASTCAGGRP